MSLKNFLTKWRYLGFDKETAEKYRTEMYISNLKIVQQICLILVFVMLAVALFFNYYESNQMKTALTVMNALISLLLYFIISRQFPRLQEVSNDKAANFLNSLVFFISYYSCFYLIYLGTFAAKNNLAVNAIWMLMFVQIIFNRFPWQNILVVFPCAIIFIFCSHFLKDMDKATYDTFHTFIVVIIGLFISWNKSRMNLQNIISSAQLKQANYTLYHTSMTDELTGMSNRRQTFKKLSKIQKSCSQNNKPLTCLVIDVDNFKNYNDFYGHPASLNSVCLGKLAIC